jgi:hypothetical protein
MACAQFADGGNGLKIWRVAVNILNEQLQRDDKEWFPSLGVGCETNNSSLKEVCYCVILHRASDLYGFLEIPK